MKQSGTTRKPYTGHKKAVVIALDVGTTFSGASYAILDPGEIPKIYEVTRYGIACSFPATLPFHSKRRLVFPFRTLLPLLAYVGAETRGLT